MVHCVYYVDIDPQDNPAPPEDAPDNPLADPHDNPDPPEDAPTNDPVVTEPFEYVSLFPVRIRKWDSLGTELYRSRIQA